VEIELKKKLAIGLLHEAGFSIIDRHETLEPMLMGGYEYIARRGKYVISYNIIQEYFSVQLTNENNINYDNNCIIKYMNISDLERTLASTIAFKVGDGWDFYNQ